MVVARAAAMLVVTPAAMPAVMPAAMRVVTRAATLAADSCTAVGWAAATAAERAAAIAVSVCSCKSPSRCPRPPSRIWTCSLPEPDTVEDDWAVSVSDTLAAALPRRQIARQRDRLLSRGRLVAEVVAAGAAVVQRAVVGRQRSAVLRDGRSDGQQRGCPPVLAATGCR